MNLIESLPTDAKLIDGTDCYYIDPRGIIYTKRAMPGRKGKKLYPSGYKIAIKALGNSYGYMITPIIMSNGSSKTVKAHRMVAQAFIPNPHGKPVVNHIDLNRSNNDVLNLEWVTSKENYHHSKKLGSYDGYKGSGIPQKEILQLNPDGSTFKEHASLKDAAIYLFGSKARRPNISRVLSGERKTCKGYGWKYK